MFKRAFYECTVPAGAHLHHRGCDVPIDKVTWTIRAQRESAGIECNSGAIGDYRETGLGSP